jgi:hypothetical protein
MKSLLGPAVALIVTITCSFAAVPDEVRKDLDKLVPEVIRLLEAKEFAAVLETLVPPDAFKKIVAETPLAAFAAKFGEKNAGELLAALKTLKDKKPKVSEDGNNATFDLPDAPPPARKSMTFTRIEKRWYLN